MYFDRSLLIDLINLQGAGLFLLFHIAFVIAYLRNDLSISDLFWGLSLSLAGSLAITLNRAPDMRNYLVLALLLCWGLRLSLHLFWRKIKRPEEDLRYQQIRSQWGEQIYRQAYFKIFLSQPLIALFIIIPVGITLSRATIPWNYFDTLGLIIALLGLAVESVADIQLARFKNQTQNRGQFIRTGLWKYSRHPNYLGEILFWWGMGFFALNSVFPWAAFNSALLTTYLLTKVTGIPVIQERYRHHPQYENYLKETNAFFPWQWRG